MLNYQRVKCQISLDKPEQTTDLQSWRESTAVQRHSDTYLSGLQNPGVEYGIPCTLIDPALRRGLDYGSGHLRMPHCHLPTQEINKLFRSFFYHVTMLRHVTPFSGLWIVESRRQMTNHDNQSYPSSRWCLKELATAGASQTRRIWGSPKI